jgi:hypothetical protein
MDTGAAGSQADPSTPRPPNIPLPPVPSNLPPFTVPADPFAANLGGTSQSRHAPVPPAHAGPRLPDRLPDDYDGMRRMLSQRFPQMRDFFEGVDQRMEQAHQAQAQAQSQQAIAQAISSGFNSFFQTHPPAASNPSSNDGSSQVRMALPVPFDGLTPSELRPFLGQCTLHFEAKPRQFPSEDVKIAFVCALLRGNPLRFVLNELNKPPNDRPIWMHNYKRFAETLVSNFGIVDEVNQARSKIKMLKQETSVANYWVVFKNLADLTQWDEEALTFQFRSGLKSKIKDMLLNFPDPSSLNELKELASRIDNRIMERYQEKKFETGTLNYRPYVNRNPVPSQSSDYSNSNVVPMEIDALEARFKKLTPEQKEYRRNNNLCLYCGSKDHIWRDCDKRPKTQVGRKSFGPSSRNRRFQTPAIPQAASVSFTYGQDSVPTEDPYEELGNNEA